MIENLVIPALLLLICNALGVSGITPQQVQVQMEKNSNRRDFMRRMEAAALVEDEISTGTETKRYNEELMSKTTRMKSGAMVPSSRRTEDAAANDDAWYEEAAYYYNWNGLGVNIADYSLKYHKCTTMKHFNGNEDNDGGNNGGSPFTENTYVTFRLCPTDSCSSDGWDGCRDTYGEYMMEMGEFIESQLKYDEEVFEQYCNYCETCMYFENYFYGNNRKLSSHACKYYDDCNNYAEVCADYYDDDSVSLTYDALSQCIPIEDAAVQSDDDGNDDGDGNQYYLGLACETTLQMAVFSDEDCTEFIGTGDIVYNITGYEVEVDDDVLGAFLTHDCISCRESDKPYKISYQDQNDQDDILEVCEEVYLASARCDYRLWEVEYESAVDQYNAERTCDFIENVIKGNINEYGQTTNDAEQANFFHKWIPQEFWPDDDIIVSQDEVAYLTMGFLGCMVMLVYVSYFKKQLAKHSTPLLDTNTYPYDSHEYPASGDTTGTFTSDASTPSAFTAKGSGDTERNFDPVAAARSID